MQEGLLWFELLLIELAFPKLTSLDKAWNDLILFDLTFHFLTKKVLFNTQTKYLIVKIYEEPVQRVEQIIFPVLLIWYFWAGSDLRLSKNVSVSEQGVSEWRDEWGRGGRDEGKDGQDEKGQVGLSWSLWEFLDLKKRLCIGYILWLREKGGKDSFKVFWAKLIWILDGVEFVVIWQF